MLTLIEFLRSSYHMVCSEPDIWMNEQMNEYITWYLCSVPMLISHILKLNVYLVKLFIGRKCNEQKALAQSSLDYFIFIVMNTLSL